MGTATVESAANRFLEHFIEGWKLVGHYTKKWFLYNIYAIAIYILFAIWVMVAGFVAGALGSVSRDVGFLTGVAVFILAPALAAYIRDAPDDPDEPEVAETS